MTIKYICDVCGKESVLANEINTVRMLVAEGMYDGDEIQLCRTCEKKISDMWCKREKK